ncbi:unnamed protein product, partial [marine sediment metagenome]
MPAEKLTFNLSRRGRRCGAQPISYLISQALANTNVISLAAGLVDYETLPVEETRRLIDKLLGDTKTARSALQYGTTQGLAELREA